MPAARGLRYELMNKGLFYSVQNLYNDSLEHSIDRNLTEAHSQKRGIFKAMYILSRYGTEIKQRNSIYVL